MMWNLQSRLSDNSFEWKNAKFQRGGVKTDWPLLHIFRGSTLPSLMMPLPCHICVLVSITIPVIMIMIMTSGWGLQQRPTSPITKKYSTLKIKIDNEAVQKLHTRYHHHKALLTLGVGDVFNNKSRQNGTRVECVNMFDTAFKRHVTVSSYSHHQGVVEQKQTKCLHLLVNPRYTRPWP